MANETAATGVAELDRALGGLYWGDNVVWVWEAGEAFRPVAVLRRHRPAARGLRRRRIRRRSNRSRRGDGAVAVARDHRRAGGHAGHQPRGLLEAARQFCTRTRRPLLLFDSLEGLTDRWGMKHRGRLLRALLPDAAGPGRDRLLVGAGGEPVPEHEPRDRADHPVHHRRRRGPHPHQQGRGTPAGNPGPAVPLLGPGRDAASCSRPRRWRGSAWRCARTGMRRELSQSDLARLAGVSPSAISQVERGERGLSLETLLALAGRLNITLDELLGGEVTPDYRIGRRHGPGGGPEARSCRCSTTPRRACAPTWSHCRERRPSRPPSPTKAPSSSGWSAAWSR